MNHTTHRHLDASDRQWLSDLATMCRSHCDFLRAEHRNDPSAAMYAERVLVWRQDRFFSIEQLVTLCESHGWNTTIYEAWVWETANQVRDLRATLNDTAAMALDLVATRRGYGAPDAYQKDLSLEYARACLEGTMTPELERRYFDEDSFDDSSLA